MGVVILTPFQRFQRLSLPLVTLYLGLVSLAKMVYQLPVIQELDQGLHNLSNRECEAVPVSGLFGQVGGVKVWPKLEYD